MATLHPKQHSRARGGKTSVTAALLAWYDVHKRDLPWRAKPGAANDPYRVWLSEIMLQQTTVTAVIPYYRAFLKRWPTVKKLARASQDEVLGAWAGLGYYSRARNLHRASNIVAGELQGIFPCSSAELRKLPGIGAYTAAAIAAIAYGEPVAAMDANAERVIARLNAIMEPLPKARKALAELAAPLVPNDRAGDFAQALMDLGSGVCLSKRPLCERCPISKFCVAKRMGIAEGLPRKAAKPIRLLKRGAAFVAFDSSGAVYLEKRPDKGLLGAMLQPPMGVWGEEFELNCAVSFRGKWTKKQGVVRHGFTHFELELEVFVAIFRARPNGEGVWFSEAELKTAALPSVMRKVLVHAREDIDSKG